MSASATSPPLERTPSDVAASGPVAWRIVETRNLRIDESALTGESVPVDKRVAPVAVDASLGDRLSVAFGGTVFAGIATLLALQACLVYLPFMHAVFGTAPLTLESLASSMLVAAIVLPVITVEKMLWSRYRERREVRLGRRPCLVGAA